MITVKFCIVGLGSIGSRHLKNMHQIAKDKNIAIEVHALRSSQVSLSDDIARLVFKSTTNIADLDAVYDAIFITNPSHKHYETLLNLRAYSNVFFIEKPVFHSSSIEMHSIGKDNSLRCYVAAPMRYSALMIALKKQLKHEKVYSARALSSSYLPQWRPTLDYRKVYSSKKEQGGGVELDIIHELDYLIDLFGFPEELMHYGSQVSHLEINSNDIATYIGRYTDKHIELHLDYFGKKTRRELELICENYTIYADFISGTLKFVSENEEKIEVFPEDRNSAYLKEMDYFFEILFNNVKNNNTIMHAFEILKLALNTR